MNCKESGLLYLFPINFSLCLIGRPNLENKPQQRARTLPVMRSETSTKENQRTTITVRSWKRQWATKAAAGHSQADMRTDPSKATLTIESSLRQFQTEMLQWLDRHPRALHCPKRNCT